MSFTDYLEQRVLNYVFRSDSDSFASPSAIYVGLQTATSTEDTATGSLSEVTGTSYQREAVTFGAPTTSGTKKQIANTNEIAFNSAGSNWGTVTHLSLFDSQSAGNWLAQVQLTDSGGTATTKTIATGDIFKIAIGDLKVTLD